MTPLEEAACAYVRYVEGDGTPSNEAAEEYWTTLSAAVAEYETLRLPERAERVIGEDEWVGLEELGDLARLRY